METLYKNFKEKYGSLLNDIYSDLLEISWSDKEDIQRALKEGYLIEIRLEGCLIREFYEAHKNLINAFLIDLNHGEYEFLQSSYRKFVRDIAKSLFRNDFVRITVDFLINTAIRIIEQERA